MRICGGAMMSKQFDMLVSEALAAERELRALTPGKPSLRCYIAECLSRGEASYEDVEMVKERLTDVNFSVHSGCGAFVRGLTRQMLTGRISEPPAKGRVGSLFFAQKDQAILELGGQPERLFLLWVLAAEAAYQQNADIFGKVEDIAAHKARIAKLETKTKDLYSRFPSTWKHDDLWIGKITSDGAALICFQKAPQEVPVYPPASAGERLVDYLLRQEAKPEREAA
jgi:hypothetical protein